MHRGPHVVVRRQLGPDPVRIQPPQRCSPFLRSVALDPVHVVAVDAATYETDGFRGDEVGRDGRRPGSVRCGDGHASEPTGDLGQTHRHGALVLVWRMGQNGHSSSRLEAAGEGTPGPGRNDEPCLLYTSDAADEEDSV